MRVLLVTLGLVFYVAVLDGAGKEQVTGQEAAVSSAPQGGAPENGAPENADSEEAAPEL